MPDRTTNSEHVFRPRARLLLLLGDQLIRDAGLAVFELVKNAYDADATRVTVTLADPTLDAPAGSVVVEDNGSGMALETVTGVWLEPGTDNRAAQKASRKPRTPVHGRLPLGEKGVGRFAAGKLGNFVELVTRAADQPEVVVRIDWAALASARYLSDAQIQVSTRPAEIFVGEATGTRLTVTQLRETWTRARVRALYRAMTSITSPFAEPAAFETEMILAPDPGWLDDLPDTEAILDQALYRATCELRGSSLSYEYSFQPAGAMTNVSARTATVLDLPLAKTQPRGKQGPLIELDEAGVGPIRMDLRVYDLEARLLQLGSLPPKSVRDYLQQNGGVRVYRDGVRVFDYGEPGNDWLDLGARRVNVPGARLSNNQILGAVHLSLDDSPGLIEKTNREGFVEDAAYAALKDAVSCAIDNITAERNQDKARLRAGTSRLSEPVTEALSVLRGRLVDRGLADELAGDVDRIEREYREAQEKLVTAAGAGLQLMVVIHEVEKGVAELALAVHRDVDIDKIRALATHLQELITGLGYLTRKSGRKREKASTLVKQALFNINFRLRAHEIDVQADLDNCDFAVKVTRRLLVATIMNVLDNSIYWSDVAAVPRRGQPGRDKRIYIGFRKDLGGGPAIVIADNGNGFTDEPALLTQAMVSRRPDGMGLGLHLADQIMRAHGGHVLFPEAGDAGVPPGVAGAVVALQFQTDGTAAPEPTR